MSIKAKINKPTKLLFISLIAAFLTTFIGLYLLYIFYQYKTRIPAIISFGIMLFLLTYTFDFNKTFILKDGFISVYRGKKNKLVKKFKINDTKSIGVERTGLDIYCVLDNGSKMVIFPIGSLNHDEKKFVSNTFKRIPRVSIKDKKGLLLK